MASGEAKVHGMGKADSEREGSHQGRWRAGDCLFNIHDERLFDRIWMKIWGKIAERRMIILTGTEGGGKSGD